MKKFVFIAVLFMTVLALAACNAETEEIYEAKEIYETVEIHGLEENEPYTTRTVSLPREMTAYDFSAEAALVVETIEATHPIFIMDGILPYFYDEFRAEYLATTAQPLSRTEFVLATQRYFTTLQDGHMGLGLLTPSLRFFQDGGFVDVAFVMRNGRVFLADEPNVEVVEIGGVSIDDIVYQIDRYYFFENESARQFHYARFLRYELMLRRAGAEIFLEGSRRVIDLTLAENGEISVREAGFLGNPPDAWPQHNYIIRHKMIDDIFYISLRTFRNDRSIAETVTAIEEAVANGTRHFIVDLRGNGGGDSRVGEHLLNAMGISVPHFGQIRRASELSRRQAVGFDTFFPSGEEVFKTAPLMNAKNPNNVFVSVLTDTYTFSSATMMATWVQDGGLGNVIGQPSQNQPSPFGDMLTLVLPKPNLSLSISWTKFLRPNAHADQLTLWPDIMVPAEDALETAIEYIDNLEV
ncbi:MAG: S41 family peptidase [Defluviitaleaceae bacterium]|nr:S41 family peptidase [Defluviitaleaceae bacterium]